MYVKLDAVVSSHEYNTRQKVDIIYESSNIT